MFERFTAPARQMVVFAQDEARLLEHNYIGSEHLLLGLLRAEEGVAADVLKDLGVTLERVRDAVRVGGAGAEPTSGQLRFTPRAKKTLEIGTREALAFRDGYITTAHILLRLTRVGESRAARIRSTSAPTPSTSAARSCACAPPGARAGKRARGGNP